MSSKWNDAEKWIINRQNMHNRNPKNTHQNGANRTGFRGSSESVKRVDFGQPVLQMGTEKFSFTPPEQHEPVSGLSSRLSESIDPCPESKDLEEVDTTCGPSPNEDKTGCNEVRSVSMRDMGTEMTSTPVGATTPLRTTNSSIPSTPRRGVPNTTPVGIDESRNPKELTEQEVKLRMRKELLQLGVQLGKMNIADWASFPRSIVYILSTPTTGNPIPLRIWKIVCGLHYYHPKLNVTQMK
ncbi:hypothetical protein L2E82_27600 [Cichorium intybus]|uniref:Uncharacterized protein n=1 Tax=Cichorium intybus TaxID=13427 RepID=A0ACB9CU25_CICIN|nr:hypothetical protein L2E82_27600 [Cichorium intybus]